MKTCKSYEQMKNDARERPLIDPDVDLDFDGEERSLGGNNGMGPPLQGTTRKQKASKVVLAGNPALYEPRAGFYELKFPGCLNFLYDQCRVCLKGFCKNHESDHECVPYMR